MREKTVTAKKTMAALATALTILASTGVPALAAENTYTSDGSANVPITATVSSSYTVVLPSTTQSLSDDDNDGTYTGTIHYDAYGKINSDKALVILAGDAEYGIGTVTAMFREAGYALTRDYAVPFHMTGSSGGQTVNGMVKHTILRFLAGSASPVGMMDTNIVATKTEPAPYEVSMSIEIPYTDTFTGNMPFSFGLADMS